MRYFLYILTTIGALSVLAVISLLAMIAFEYIPSESHETASKDDVLFVLNWGGLDNKQNYSVLYSYASTMHPMGDHLTYHCIQLEEFNPSESSAEEWVEGEETNSFITDARESAAGLGMAEKCFGVNVNGNDKNIMAYVWSIHIFHRRVSGAKIILYHKGSRRLLYTSHQT